MQSAQMPSAQKEATAGTAWVAWASEPLNLRGPSCHLGSVSLHLSLCFCPSLLFCVLASASPLQTRVSLFFKGNRGGEWGRGMGEGDKGGEWRRGIGEGNGGGNGGMTQAGPGWFVSSVAAQ